MSGVTEYHLRIRWPSGAEDSYQLGWNSYSLLLAPHNDAEEGDNSKARIHSPRVGHYGLEGPNGEAYSIKLHEALSIRVTKTEDSSLEDSNYYDNPLM